MKHSSRMNFYKPIWALAVFFLMGVQVVSIYSQRLFSQEQKLLANPATGATGFGNAVAISGETMVIGASNYDTTPSTGINIGAAYVFVRNNGTWTQQARLGAADGAAGDEFGYSVAISGNTIVVGAWRSNSPASNSGAAYVFVRSGSTWTQQQKLTANDGAADDEFGNAVAIEGNTVAVGSHSADQPGGGHAGAVYIFNRSGEVWSQSQKLIPTGTVLFGDFLGESVAMSGDTLVAGASGDQEPTRANRGTVYVYARSGGTWTQQQKLIVPDSQPSTQLGSSVAIDGDTIVSGALGDTPTTSSPNQGAVYIFSRASGNVQQRLTASDAAMSDFFGWSVAVRGNVVVVGARHDDTIAGADAGSAYVFRRGDNLIWAEQQKLAAIDSAVGDRFGGSVSLSDSMTLAVGAAEKNLPMGQGNGAGAAYIFKLLRSQFVDFDGDGKTDISVFRPSGGNWFLINSSNNSFSSAQFGISGDRLAPADYDGDGKTDIAVFRDGTWYLLRSSLGFTAAPFGSPGDLPRPGDFDGDGKADIAVFRPSSGYWYLSRSSLGFTSVQFGQSGDAPLIADFDGDGKTDLTVYRQGAWYYLQSSDGAFRAAPFGTSEDTPSIGDFDGDGKADIAVFRPSSGYWYLSRSSLGFTSVQFGANGDRPAAGDYDGDGKTDVAVYRQGAWYVLRSSDGQFSASQFGVPTDQPVPAAFIP